MKQLMMILAVLSVMEAGLSNVWADHTGPSIEMSLENEHPVIEWDNTLSFLGEDPPFGRTLEQNNAGTLSPAFHFAAGTTPKHLTYSFTIDTPLFYWNPLDPNPHWGPTQNGEFMRIRDDAQVVTVITDGVSVDSPTSMPVSESYIGGIKAGELDVSEDHLHVFELFTPDGNGGQTPSGSSGAYGFGMRVRFWQGDDQGNLLVDYGFSDPFFLGFRVRDMLPTEFAAAVASGQALVPEPMSCSILIVGGTLLMNSLRKSTVN